MASKSPDEILSEILQWLKDKHGILCSNEESLWGHKCRTVFHGQTRGDTVVVKIGLTPEANREVLMNQAGYNSIRNIGADAYLPHPCAVVSFEGIPILIMQDCGENLFITLQKSKDPKAVYNRFIGELSNLYQLTIKDDLAGEIRQNLSFISTELEKQFRRYLHIFELFEKNEYLFEAIKYRLSVMQIFRGCFACWDFTPEDVFLLQGSLKIIDPPKIVFGLPMVDMACFSGVVRDVYKLPGAEYGYQRLQKFSHEIGSMLGISLRDSRFLFNLGRALQCSLSSRFRIEKDPDASKKFFQTAKSFLLKCSS